MRKNKLRPIFLFLSLLGITFFLAGCATQSCETPASIPGFWKGLLHGFIIFFSFIGSLFTDWTIYAYPNKGPWYDLGFMIGASIFFGGSGGAAGANKNKKCQD